MSTTIVVAGGTGNLGNRIIMALLKKGAVVHAPVRVSSDKAKVDQLKEQGVKVFEVNMLCTEALAKVCEGASCVVSALQGLADVIVDTQTVLLHAAVKAGVLRFIPSDFSVDFTKIASENRNFDLRRQFHQELDKTTTIAATSIFNGAFADILTYNTPLLDLKKKSIGYWGDKADWHLDFTTMDDVAAFTAAAALDKATPRKLNIASFQITPAQMQALASQLTNTQFALNPMGSLEAFAAYNKQQRAADPEGETQLYSRWQSGQYMHDQFSSHHEHLDNDRYPDIKWTSAQQFISGIV